MITLLIALAFFINNRNFLRIDSLQGIMQTMSITGIMAVGMSYLFIGGGIDLSMTFVSLFSGVICAMMIRSGIPWGIAVVLTLLIGAGIGAINAFFVTKIKIMAFISTIAMSMVLQGVNLILTNAQDIAVAVADGHTFAWGSRTIWVFPVPFVIMTLLIVIYGVILTKTQFGRNVYLVGGNEYAARLAGVNPLKVRAILYINAAFLSAMAGIVFTSRMRSAAPSTAADWQMNAITASILGGVAFGGGSGSMLGCFIGIAMLNIFNAGLSSIALAAHWTTMAQGALLLIALAADFVNERSRQKALRVKAEVPSKVTAKEGA
ncbi:MAG: ABC transporter permease [Oscillospiraceae bacterium]|nr:ABC transporter permease [Oscillospiraceae bacterium]